MAHDKKHITAENIDEWLSSTGYLFPRTELELTRFEKLYAESIVSITGKEIDPDKIINEQFDKTKIIPIKSTEKKEEFTEYKMVARNGNDVPRHILDKMKKNQDDARNKDDGSSKEKDK